MKTFARRLVAVSALAIGLSGLGGVVATAAYAEKVCIINGVQKPCPKPEYANDCEGELRRTDCGGDYDSNGNKVGGGSGNSSGGQAATSGGGTPAKKAQGGTTSSPKKKSTTTSNGKNTTTVTVDETTNEVTVNIEPTPQYMTRMYDVDRRMAFRYGPEGDA